MKKGGEMRKPRVDLKIKSVEIHELTFLETFGTFYVN